MRKYNLYFFLVGLIFLSLGACSTAKYVDEEQSLLDDYSINLNKDIEIKNKTLLKVELSSFLRQRPNGNLFWFIPREWFYFRNATLGDTCWYNNWGRNSIGEAPVFLDRNKMRESAASMEKYLRNTKGFYNARVEPNIHEKGHKSSIDYNIVSGPRHKVKSIEYIGRDTSILKILERESANSLIQVGDPLDALTFQKETTRLINEIQNNGYATFQPNYLKLYGDSTDQENTVEIFYQVLPPLPDSIHRKYKVGQVNIYTDFYNDQNIQNTTKDTIDNYIFHRETKDYIINPEVILSKIYLNYGDYWTNNAKSKTFRKLSDLSIYRFVSLNSDLSNTEDSLINYNIFLTPVTSKYVLESGVDLNYSAVNSITGRQLFGISGNGLINVRNLFQGSEAYTFSVDNGYEFNLDTFRLRTFSLGINNALEIPKFMDLLGTAYLLNKINALPDSWLQNIKEEASTTFNLGLNYITIRDFYRINSFNASIVNNYPVNNRLRILFRPTTFALNSSELESRFLAQINNNPNIINTFADNLITGYLFNEIRFVYNSNVTPTGNSFTLLGNFEVSGWETHLANSIYNKVSSGDDKTWSFADNVNYAKFIKLEFDGRYYKKVSPSSNLAFRLNSGIAVPFGGNEAVPFIRQFSVGGPNSMRGWRQKELGPGGFEEKSTSNSQIFFQQGDIKLELNAEYRFQIFTILEGAFFTDIGNVWTLKEDKNRPDAQFNSSFYNQMAVSGGWGIRWDFEYFNIRFDFSYKLRSPFTLEDGSSQWYNWKKIKAQRLGTAQVAVNYPF